MSLARRPAEPGGYTTFRRKPKAPSKRSLDPVLPAVYAAVMRRDGDCLLRGSTVSAFAVPCSGDHQWAHRRAVTYGGPSAASNGTRLCVRHHARVDGVYRAEARALGLHLRRHDDPASTPVTLADGRVVYLDDEGNYREEPA